MEELYQQLSSANPLPTSNVNENVSSENAKLKAEIEKLKEDRQKTEEKIKWRRRLVNDIHHFCALFFSCPGQFNN